MPTNLAENLGKTLFITGWAGILKLGLQIGATLAFGTIIYAGFRYLTGADNASQQKDALDWLKAAVLGLSILAFGYLIFTTVNPSILNQTISNIQEKQDVKINTDLPTSFEVPTTSPSTAPRGAAPIPLP